MVKDEIKETAKKDPSAKTDKQKSSEERKMARLTVKAATIQIDELMKGSSVESKQYLCGLCYKHYRSQANAKK